MGGRSLRWRHNDQYSVSNHQPHGCLLNRLFRRRWKKTSKLRVTGLCVGNSPGPVNSPHKGPVTRKMFPFDDVIMTNHICVNRLTSECEFTLKFQLNKIFLSNYFTREQCFSFLGFIMAYVSSRCYFLYGRWPLLVHLFKPITCAEQKDWGRAHDATFPTELHQSQIHGTNDVK